MKVSADGLISLSMDELLTVGLKHYFSGLDEGLRPRLRDCGRPVRVSGYTEWVNSANPKMSIGWDWRIETTPFGPLWIRVGLPRTNVLLVQPDGEATEWATNLRWLATVADALPWQEQVPHVIETRYSWISELTPR